MEGIGERLRSAREARKLTVKNVSNDTNIASIFITALENEEFDKFPSETYIVGFLRNYSEYLKLDAEEMVQSFKGYKIGESATPVEQLIKPTQPKIILNFSSLFHKYRNIFYLSGIIIILAFAGWIFRGIFQSDIDIENVDSIENIKNEYNNTKKRTNIRNIRNLSLSNDSGYALVYRDEAVQLLVDNEEFMFLLKDIKNNLVILEIFPGNTLEIFKIEKPRTIRVKDFSREIIFTLKGLTENRAKLLVMLGQKIEGETESASIVNDISKDKDNTKVFAQNEKNLKIVFEAQFIQKTYLELYLDGMRKMKGIIPAGRRERWEAVEYIQLKIGNAGGLKAKINGKAYTFGHSGQVANKVITWKKDLKNPNLYHIVVKDW
ncbi:MAG: DUF4115 domain-containing protein [Spirochaetota bacterium]|nr:DUF4115 domain-containing protein [Spirochaetota bacterium]